MTVFKVETVERMEILGGLFSQIIKPGDVFALCGQLGAGKTSFVRGFVKSIDPEISVKSPSFVLIREYNCKPFIYHCDMYRIHSAEEAFNIGIEDHFYSEGITFVEWAENIKEILPPDHIKIEFNYDDNDVRDLKCYVPDERKKDIEEIYEHFSN